MMEPSPPSDAAAITWIHLSDFHAGQRGGTSWYQAEVELEKNVRELAGHLGRPDLVIFTGDLANQGAENEYKKVDRLLGLFNKWLGVEKLPVFAVPGNHDVQRPSARTAYQYEILKNYEQSKALRERLWEHPGTVPEIWRLFQHYSRWAGQRIHPSLHTAGWEPHCSSRMPGDLSVVVEKSGIRLRLVGLNTAWAHIDNNIDDGVPLPVEQFHAALPESPTGNPLDWFKGDFPSFLITHHPPSCLSAVAHEGYLAQIYDPKRFALALYGHQHMASSEVVSRAGGAARSFYQSPSLFGLTHYGTKQEVRAFGYSWGRITARGEIRVWPQKFVPRGDGTFKFDRDQSFTPTRDELGGTILVEGRPREQSASTRALSQTRIGDWDKLPAVRDFIAQMLVEGCCGQADTLASVLNERCPAIRTLQEQQPPVHVLVHQWFANNHLDELLHVLTESGLARDFTSSASIAFSWATRTSGIPQAALERHLRSLLKRDTGLSDDLRNVKQALDRWALDGSPGDKEFVAELAMAATRDLYMCMNDERKEIIHCVLTYPTRRPPLHVLLDEHEDRLLLAAVSVAERGKPTWISPTTSTDPHGDEDLVRSVHNCLASNGIEVDDLANYILVVHVNFKHVTKYFHERLDHEFDGVVIWPYANDQYRDPRRGILPESRIGRSIFTVDRAVPAKEGLRIALVQGSDWNPADAPHYRRLATVVQAGSGDLDVLTANVFDDGTPLFPADVLTQMIRLRRRCPEHDMHIIWTDRRTYPPQAPLFRNPR